MPACYANAVPVWAVPILVVVAAPSNVKQWRRSRKILAKVKKDNTIHKDTLKNALDRDPNNPQLHIEFALECMRNGETEKALSTLEYAVKLGESSGSSAPLFFLALVQTSLFQSDEAVATCDLILKKGTNEKQSGHKFLLTDFRKRTFCYSCKKKIKGIRKQGYKCTACENIFHLECSKEPDICPASIKTQQTPSQSSCDSSHQLSQKKFFKPTWCHTCDRLIRISQHPQFCSKCENSFHPTCVSSKDYCLASPIEMNITIVLNLRGTCYYNLRRYDEAIKDFSDAISLSTSTSNDNNKENHVHESNIALPHANLGLCYFEKKEMEKAVVEFTTAITLGLRDSKVFNTRAIAYQILGKLEEANRDRFRFLSDVLHTEQTSSFRIESE